MSECTNYISEPKREVCIILERPNFDRLVLSKGKKFQPSNI